jgi:hypothetical protein
MARPSPNVILRSVENDMRAIEVCDAYAVYAVCYKGRPVKVRTFQNVEVPYPGPKYLKSSFPESGHAFNLADKLNEKFATTDFSVVMMTTGRTIREN